jgi:hypothetical protein
MQDQLQQLAEEAATEAVNSTDEREDKECQVKKVLLEIKDIQIDHKKQHYDTSIEIIKETHYIKKSLDKRNTFVMGIVFVCGMVVGASLWENKEDVAMYLEPLSKIIGFGNKVTQG